jgi:hypothetical protein
MEPNGVRRELTTIPAIGEVDDFGGVRRVSRPPEPVAAAG